MATIPSRESSSRSSTARADRLPQLHRLRRVHEEHGPHFDRPGEEEFFRGLDWDEFTPVFEAEDPSPDTMRRGASAFEAE